MRYLVEELGADVNARDKGRSTPIMFASQHGYSEAVSTLIAAGADLYARGHHGFAALDFAVQNEHEEVIELIRRTLGAEK